MKSCANCLPQRPQYTSTTSAICWLALHGALEDVAREAGAARLGACTLSLFFAFAIAFSFFLALPVLLRFFRASSFFARCSSVERVWQTSQVAPLLSRRLDMPSWRHTWQKRLTGELRGPVSAFAGGGAAVHGSRAAGACAPIAGWDMLAPAGHVPAGPGGKENTGIGVHSRDSTAMSGMGLYPSIASVATLASTVVPDTGAATDVLAAAASVVAAPGETFDAAGIAARPFTMVSLTTSANAGVLTGVLSASALATASAAAVTTTTGADLSAGAGEVPGNTKEAGGVGGGVTAGRGAALVSLM